jgi:hypothetical protein
MDYARINLTSLCIESVGDLPSELRGLDAAALANVSGSVFPVPRAHVGVGYWPVEDASPEYDKGTHRLSGEFALEVDASERRVIRTAGVADIPPEQLAAARREEILLQLRQTDAAFDPRWHEDARAGDPPHASEQAWLNKRAGLRATLALLS